MDSTVLTSADIPVSASREVRAPYESLSGLLPGAAGFGFVLSLREAAEILRKSAEYSEQIRIAAIQGGLASARHRHHRRSPRN